MGIPVQSPTSRAALGFIMVTILLDSMSFGVVAPVLPELVMELTGQGLSAAARYGGWLVFSYALIQFFAAPVLGNLSDRFGRRPVLLFSLFAFGLDYLVMGFAPTLTWLFVSRGLAGVFGATFATAGAYIADVTPPEGRARGFGMIGAAWGVGFILGPVAGGILGEYGARLPFFVAAGLALLNVLYGLLVLPESLPVPARRRFALDRANPLGALLQIRRYPVVAGLFGALFLYQIAHDANPSTWTYFTMERFGWSESQVGYSIGFVGLMIALVQGGLIQVAIARLGARRAVYLGFALYAMGFLGYAFATRGWMLYAFVVPFALGSIANPALKSIMSNQVPANAQGELQGAITSLQSLTAIVAPLLMTQLFGFFTSERAPVYFPGAAFFTAALLALASAALSARAIRVTSG